MQNEGKTVRLEQADMEMDLGAMVEEQLTFETHINEKINKASRVMGLIRRSFVYLNQENFERVYIALVRPHLKFGNNIWSPIRKKDISLENVQRRATRMIPGLKNLPYEERLKALQLPTLVYRRLRGDMIEAYKIATGK